MIRRNIEGTLRLVSACILAAVLATCGIAGVTGTADLREDRERSRRLEAERAFINALHEAVKAQLEWGVTAESLAVRSLLE